MKRRRFLATCAGALLGGCQKTPSFAGYAYIACAGSESLAVVDFVALGVTGRLHLGGRPGQVFAPPRTQPVYVTLPETGSIVEVDGQAGRTLRRVRLARQIQEAKLDAGGRHLWVLTAFPSSLLRLPLDSLKPEGGIPLPPEASQFELSPDESAAAISLEGAGAFLLADLKSGQLSPQRRVARRAGFVAFRSDGRILLAADTAANQIIVLEPRDLRTIVRLPLPLRPERYCWKSDGGQLFITGSGWDGVTVVYPYRTEIAQTALAGPSPGVMAASTSPDYLFVANPTSGAVTILEIDTMRVIAVTAVGANPGFLLLTPDQSYVLALNRASGDLALIRPAAISYQRAKRAPLFTMIRVGSEPAWAAVRPA